MHDEDWWDDSAFPPGKYEDYEPEDAELFGDPPLTDDSCCMCYGPLNIYEAYFGICDSCAESMEM